MLRLKNIRKKHFLLLYFTLVLSVITQAQIDADIQKEITYPDFIKAVVQNNIAYAAEKLNINIAEANIEKSKIIPDPEFTAGIFNNDQHKMKMGYGYNIGLDWTLELGGKRKARVDLAKSESELSKYILQDYFRNLRADATVQYLTAIHHEQLMKLQFNSYETMDELAKSDSLRAKLGTITAIDAKQSKLEAKSIWNEAIQSIGNWKGSLSSLNLLMGSKHAELTQIALVNFSTFDRSFYLDDLIVHALSNRADLLYALQNKDVSEKMIRLTKVNRVLDLGITTGVTRNAEARNDLAPSPAFTSANFGISIPLKFSNHRKGELKEAFYTAQQAGLQHQEIELQVQTEVKQAFYNYEATQKQLQQFNSGILDDAKAILTGKLYSYKRGDSSLLEVLHAQRTYIEVQQNYYEILFNNAHALVILEQSAGIWDILF